MQSNSNTLKKKIFIETSALIAASVHIPVEDRESLHDEFYSESTFLFETITKHFESRIGVTSKTVEIEAKGKLIDVVTRTLQQGAPEQAQSFQAKSHHLNKCLDRMDRYLRYLSIEPAPIELTRTLVDEITKMYKELMARSKPFWKLEQLAKAEVEKEWTPEYIKTLKTHVSEVQRVKQDRIQNAYEQKIREHYQLHRLFNNAASKTDKQILAEAILIYRHYSTIEKGFQLFLASCDSNNFCPFYSKEHGLSRPVTDEIRFRFKIICERPKELAKMLRDELEQPQEEYLDEGDEEDTKDENNDERQEQ